MNDSQEAFRAPVTFSFKWGPIYTQVAGIITLTNDDLIFTDTFECTQFETALRGIERARVSQNGRGISFKFGGKQYDAYFAILPIGHTHSIGRNLKGISAVLRGKKVREVAVEVRRALGDRKVIVEDEVPARNWRERVWVPRL